LHTADVPYGEKTAAISCSVMARDTCTRVIEEELVGDGVVG
jgi:hypothetical protein